MPAKELFSERQRFKQLWLWAVLIGIDGLILYGLIRQVFFGEPFGNKPASNEQLLAATVVVLLVTLLFAFLRLDTAIREDGIYYRFLPFQPRYKKISWDRVSKASVRKYHPIAEYGGWGLRLGLFGKGQAFNVSGDKGLQLVYDNGKKFLLGTQRPQEMEAALQQIGQLSRDD